MNISLGRKVLETLASLGVEDILLCAGARNAPLVVLLEKTKGFRISNFFEERSAGFFALGRAQRDQKPVAIITTSGTAVAELLPAAVEATYTQTPLIFVTADRPRNYRGTGAPQAIDQVGIFFQYVETCLDIAHLNEELDVSLWTRKAPLQINVCFSEPLIDEDVPVLDVTTVPRAIGAAPGFVQTLKRSMNQPLVIAGPMTPAEADQVAPALEKLGAPIYVESLSNLGAHASLQKFILRSGDRTVRELFIKGLCQSVLRIGGVPTLRFWRDLEETFQNVPVNSISNSDYTGLGRSVHHIVGFENLNLIKAEWRQDPRSEIFDFDQNRAQTLKDLMNRYPQSEVALMSRLSNQMTAKFCYVGNSLPIREWDLVQALSPKTYRQSGNRGANGIDGQISSFLGGSQSDGENWALLGDLTTLYDLSAPWAAREMKNTKLRLVVINNQGGLIFKNIFDKDIFLNRHAIEFSAWAQMWNWGYQKWTSIPEKLDLAEKVVIELCPDPEQSHQFWQEYKAL